MRKFTAMLIFLLTGILAYAAVDDNRSADFSKALALQPAKSYAATGIKTSTIDAKAVKFSAGKVSASVYATATRLRAKSRRTAVGSISDYIGSRYALTHPTSGVMRYSAATVTRVTDDSVAISGFIFTDVTIGAKIDFATGKVTITPQKVTELTEGPVSICPVDIDNRIYSTTDAIEGTVQDGNIYIDTPFGFFVTEGSKKGAYLTIGFQNYCYVATANGRVHNQTIKFDTYMSTNHRTLGSLDSWVHVRQFADDEIKVANMPSDQGAFDLDGKLAYGGNTVNFDPQPVYTVGILGTQMYNYQMIETIKDTTVTISGKLLDPTPGAYKASGDSATITLGSWMIGRTSSGFVNLFNNSTITFAGAVNFPEAPKANFEGEGTEASPYLIKTIDDLKALAYLVNSNDRSLRPGGTSKDVEDESYYAVAHGKFYKLASDIDFSAYKGSFTPIGTKDYRFAGTFDGDGHTITGFKIENYAYDYAGLFGIIGATGTVKNLKFNNAKVTTIGYNAGVVAGRSYGKIDNVVISNSSLSATEGYGAGLIAGGNYNGEVTNSKISNGRVSSLGMMGGALGRNHGKVAFVEVKDVTVQQLGKQVFSGGVVGYSTWLDKKYSLSEISDCSFSGTVYSSLSQICLGGIAGELANTKMERCFTAARILGGNTNQVYLGGLTGATWNAQINNCYASGMVENKNCSFTAGLIGEDAATSAESASTISNSYSSVQLLQQAGTDSLSGITGEQGFITVSNCYFDTQMAGFTHAAYGKSTSFLTSGEPIEGFDTSIWQFTAGQYPRLKANDTTDIAYVSAAPVVLNANDQVGLVKNDFTYSTAHNVVWRAIVNNRYNTEGGHAFTFTNGTGVLNYQQYTDTLEASLNGASKLAILNIAPMPFKGEGTAENPWTIGTREEFKQFSEISNKAKLSFQGKFVKLTADIDMQGDTITPVDKDNYGKLRFEGTFDGNGHTIDNFTILAVAYYGPGESKPEGEVNPRSDDSYYNAGLFANLGANGVIKNLTVGKNARYYLFMDGGAIAGLSLGRIENCANYAPVDVYFASAGGIVGEMKAGAVTTQCYNAGTVRAGSYQAGGIAGNVTSAEVSNSINTGFVGATFINSYQPAGKQYLAGGVVGNASKATIANVVNTGEIESLKQVGGIVGTAANTTVENAVNYGFVKANESTTLGQITGKGATTTYANVMFDNQVQKAGGVANAAHKGVSGLTTAQLTTGKLALPDSLWSQAAQSYPTIKSFADYPEAKLAKLATVFLADGNFATAVTKPATLGNTGTVKWAVKEGKSFSIAGSTLSVTIPEKGGVADTLVAAIGKDTRLIPVNTINGAIFEGSGTQADPFKIKTAQDMVALAEFVNTYAYDYASNYFTVEADLDFSGIDYTPVAAGNVMFNADFNGNGKTIKNLKISKLSDKTATYQGLFGIIGELGAVHDLTIEGNVEAYQYVGAVAGSVYGKIYNVTNKANVKANSYAGGVAGYAGPMATLKGISNYASVTTTGNYAGGVVAASDADAGITIDSCSNYGVVSGAAYAGGIAASASATVSHSINDGAAMAKAANAGGILAEAKAPSSVSFSHNTGNVEGTQYVAGIVGTAAVHTAAARMTVDSCYNEGNVTPVATTGSAGYIAGIVGQGRAGLTIKNCYNTASIIAADATTPKARNISGIVATMSGSKLAPDTIYNCYNTGDMHCLNTVAGIVANPSGDSCMVINKVYNTGKISASNTSSAYAGGIAGTGGFWLTESWNAGTITATGSYVGGIVAYLTGSKYKFERNANYGDVSSTQASSKSNRVGGLIGQGRPYMKDCYNFGNVTAYQDVAGIMGQPGNAHAASYAMTISNTYNAGKVEATSGTNAANITAANSNCEPQLLTVSDTWFDSSVNPLFDADTQVGENAVKGLDTRALTDLKISDAFDNATACYPSLKVFSNVDYNSFAVATVLLKEGERLDSVASAFQIGTPAGAVWTSSPNLEINGNDVTLKNTTSPEAATLTLTVGKLTRTYDLVIARQVTGVDANLAGKAVAKRTYYNVSGIEVVNPTKGQILIEKVTYTDGTTSARKVVYKDK